jgi:hypothetical protein
MVFRSAKETLQTAMFYASEIQKYELASKKPAYLTMCTNNRIKSPKVSPHSLDQLPRKLLNLVFGNKRHKPITRHNHPHRRLLQQHAHGFQLNRKTSYQSTVICLNIPIIGCE